MIRNRLLAFPAIASAAGFLMLYASIAQSTDRSAPRPARRTASPRQLLPAESELVASLAAGGLRDGDPNGSPDDGGTTPAEGLDREAAQQRIRNEVLDPWSLYTLPRHKMFSRVRVSPKFLKTSELASLQENDAFFLAVLSLAVGLQGEPQQVPLVMNRQSQAMFVFVDGAWQSHVQWLKTLRERQLRGRP